MNTALQTDASRQINKNTDQIPTVQKQKPHSHGGHHEHAHDQLDSDCEGCQKQKKQNEKLVDFYHRLDKISNKMKKIKTSKNHRNQLNLKDQNEAQNQQEQTQKVNIQPQQLQLKLKCLDQKLNIGQLPSIGQIKDFSSKQIGFQLAAALLQRQMKYKSQNKKLQQKINQLLVQKRLKQQSQAHLYHISHSKMNSSTNFNCQNLNYPYQKPNQSEIQDSLDVFKGSQRGNERKNKNDKDDSNFWDIEASSTDSFKYQETTFFQTKNRNSNRAEKTKFTSNDSTLQQQIQAQLVSPRNKKKNPYSTEQGHGLNLWLYQFKTQEYDDNILKSWMSDKNKKSQNSERYKTNKRISNPSVQIKTPPLSNINKTTIIEKNIVSYNQPKTEVKKRKY